MDIKQDGFYSPVTDRFQASHINSIEAYHKLYNESISDPTAFWAKQVQELLHWQHDFQMVSDCDFSEGLVFLVFRR